MLERCCTRLWATLALTLLVGLVSFGLSRTVPNANAQVRTTGEILTVRGLVVVDESGIERIRIGAPLPDPIVQGKRVPRQGQVSGILILDSDGTNGTGMSRTPEGTHS